MSDSPYSTPNSGSSAADPVGRVRFAVLGWLCALSGILYLDRICISAALDAIQKDLKISNTQTGIVLMSFTLAYGLFEIPTGRWGDLLGARRVLTRISLWWSFFTALTGACFNLGSLVVVRFLFGAGEAGAFPNAARVVSRWFPIQERGRVQGILLAASQVGGALSPFLATTLIARIGWRWTFVVFGSLGLLWAAGFRRWYRDEPSEHPSVTPEEARYIGEGTKRESGHAPIPWELVLSNPSIWILSLIMICASFNSYIYFSWFPKYLVSGRGVSTEQSGVMASVVLSFAAAGTLAGGTLMDLFNVTSSLARRRAAGGAWFTLAAIALFLALTTNHAWAAVLLTACSCFATQATQPLWWSCAIGISGRHVGALFGLMNSAGVVGAMASQLLVGVLADWFAARGYSGRAQWDPIFWINLGVLVTAAVLWLTFVFREVEPHGDH